MKKLCFFLLLSFVILATLSSDETLAQEIQADKKTDSPLIGNLKRLHKTSGCDCKLQTLKESRRSVLNRFVFQSDATGTPAWMNIDGKDVSLKMVSASFPTNGVTLGSRYHKRFIGKGVFVLIKYVINAVCPEENPDCDEEGHKATIIVTKEGRKHAIKTFGMCGWC